MTSQEILVVKHTRLLSPPIGTVFVPPYRLHISVSNLKLPHLACLGTTCIGMTTCMGLLTNPWYYMIRNRLMNLHTEMTVHNVKLTYIKKENLLMKRPEMAEAFEHRASKNGVKPWTVFSFSPIIIYDYLSLSMIIYVSICLSINLSILFSCWMQARRVLEQVGPQYNAAQAAVEDGPRWNRKPVETGVIQINKCWLKH